MKPKLRNYEAYMADMTDFAKHEAERLFKETDGYFNSTRELYHFVKVSGANVSGLRPVKKDRRRICNRLKKKRIYDAKISYSKSISSGEFAT